MAKFKVYATQMVYYVSEVEVKNVEDILFDDIDYDDFKEYDSNWQIEEIVEVQKCKIA